MRVTGALLLGLTLAACGSSDNVKRVNATPPSVSYAVDSTEHLDEANARAEDFCTQYRRHAQLLSLDPQNGSYVANYNCR